jgi:diguanylate cyclase (GGDEF)-like protein/PAS domain S-box-containing protein
MNAFKVDGPASPGEQPGSELTEVLLQVLQQAPAPIMLTDPRGFILRVNSAFERATGYVASELKGQRPNRLKSGLQSDSFYQGMWASLIETGHWQGEVWNRHKNGRTFQECLSIVALRQANGAVSHYLGMYSGLAHPLLARQKMAAHAETDGTTGLLNRCAFVAALERLSEQRGLVHVLALDIDDFTEFNEEFGLHGGDTVLRQVALRCTEVAAASGGNCIVGRVGPDEFALGMVAPTQCGENAQWIKLVADKLTAVVGVPYELEGPRKATISASIGLALFEQGGGTAAEALLHASSARQQSGGADCQALRRYEAQDGERRLSRALQEAIRLDQIQLAYQPKVDLHTGLLSGVEGLARWTLEDGSSVPPAEFIPLAERRGLIGPLGDRVLERAVGQLAQWRTQGLPLPVVAINFSALQFHRNEPARQVADALARHDVPPQLLELELTESLLIGEMDTVMQALKDLRALGIALSIDDFGTGYSSLAYLRRFPIQYLKIDRRFVMDMVTDPGALEVVKMIVSLAHRLGLRCIAEGIETPEQLALLRAIGCDEGQGFLLARPMSAQDLTAALASVLPWHAVFASLKTVESALSDPDQVSGCQPCAYSPPSTPFPTANPHSDSRLERSAMQKSAETGRHGLPTPVAFAALAAAPPRPEGGVCRIV